MRHMCNVYYLCLPDRQLRVYHRLMATSDIIIEHNDSLANKALFEKY